MNDATLAVVLAVLLVSLSAFLAMAETALNRVDRFRAQHLVDEKRRGAVALLRLVATPERFAGSLNSVLLMLLAAQITAATATAFLLLDRFDGPLLVLGVFVEIGVVYVLAEATPKTLAVQHPERTALLCAPVIAALARILPMRLLTRPLIWVANLLAPGEERVQGPFVHQQQMLALAASAAEDQIIEHDEHALLHSVIEFGTTVAREVMVPRTDMITVGADWTAGEAIDLAIAKGFSRFPVMGTEGAGVTGTLFTKDLMSTVRDGGESTPVSRLARPSKYIPESKRVAELLGEMQREKVHMAIVVDEYGSVVGLVTLEDLVEEVVGDISDEYDAEEQPQTEHLGDGEWRVDARMPVNDVFARTGLKLPHGDWDTLGGLLIDAFGRVPSRNESITVDDHRITVEQTSGRRVIRVRVRTEAGAADAAEVAHAAEVPHGAHRASS